MPTASSNSSKHVRRRKIADLSEEQRERKRNTDRQAQQAFRERTKAQIQDLEDEIETMRRNAAESEDAWRFENTRLRERVRQLTHRLEQIKRLTTGQLDSGFDDTDQLMAGTQIAETGAQVLGRHTSDSPGSIIVVAEIVPSPRHSDHGLQDENELLEDTGSNACNSESRPLSADRVDQEPSEIAAGVIPTASPGLLNNGLESPAAPASDAPHDVLMGSYDMVLSPDHAAVTPSLHQWLPHPSMSAHSTSPGMIDHSLQYRRKVQEVVCEHPYRTCPFDHILLDLINARKLILSGGSAFNEAIGPAQADIAGLFHSEKVQRSHPISRILVEMMQTFAHVNLPERVAFMYKIHKTLRWHISPSKSTYDVLPSWLRPTAKQITTPHAAWVDNIPWPAVRDMLIEQPEKYPFEQFSEVYSLHVTISWPHREDDIIVNLEEGVDQSYSLQAMVNPIFERHIRDLDNWTVAQGFKDCFPEMSEAVSSRH